jgi:putative component of toxin-antitoxin plasmid stabilization module
MAKLPDDDDDVLYPGEHFVIRAMTRRNGRRPAKEWLQSLEKAHRGRFLAAAQIMENTLRSGRPPAGRAGKIATSREGLWELRVTPQGGDPPHLRLTYLRDGNTLWAATGFTKTTNELETSDIRQADNVTRDWRQTRERGTP